jgi:hypothetical protein
MKARYCFETSVLTMYTAQRHNPEDCREHPYRRENFQPPTTKFTFNSLATICTGLDVHCMPRHKYEAAYSHCPQSPGVCWHFVTTGVAKARYKFSLIFVFTLGSTDGQDYQWIDVCASMFWYQCITCIIWYFCEITKGSNDPSKIKKWVARSRPTRLHHTPDIHSTTLPPPSHNPMYLHSPSCK